MGAGMKLREYLRSARHRSARQLMMVGNRIGNPMFKDFTNGSNFTQFQQYAVFPVMEDCVNPEFDFINATVGGAAPSALTLKVGMGTSTTSARTVGAWASNGQQSVTLDPGAVDTVRFTGSFAKGSKIYLVYFGQYATAANWICSGYTSSSDYNEVGNALTDKTGNTGAWPSSGRPVPDTILRPVAMRAYVAGAQSTAAIVTLTGDSIASGAVTDNSGGTTVNGLSYSGWANRALAQLNCAWTNNGYQGLTVGTIVNESAANQAIRTVAEYNPLNKVKIAILALGTNDLSATTNTTTYNQLLANVQTVVARNTANGIKTIVCTATPRTDGNNTASSVPYRPQFNAWVRSTYGALCFDVAALTQDATNNELWRTDLGAPTPDGIHPYGVLHTAIMNAFISAFPGFLTA